MKVHLSWGLVALIFLLAFAFTKRALSKTEASLEAALQQQAIAAGVHKQHDDSLQGVAQRLRDDSAQLARQAAVAQVQASKARSRVDSLLALSNDTALAHGVAVAFAADSGVLASCANTLTNCEARAANAESRARGDSVLLVSTQALLDTTRRQWESTLHPSLFTQAWKARAVTLPLAILVILQALRH